MTANPWPEVYAVNSEVQRMSAGFMAVGQTAKQYVGLVNSQTGATTTVPLETVTAGKTFYVTDILVTTDAASGANSTVDFQLLAAAAVIFRAGIHALCPADLPGLETQPFATSGQAVSISIPATSGGAARVWYNIYGFEQ